MLIKLFVVIGLFVAIAFALRHAPRSGRRNGDTESWPGFDGDGSGVGDSSGQDGGGDSGGDDGGGGD